MPVVIDPTQRQRGEASMASNLETTRKGYELFKQGDIPTLVKDIVDDTCIWISPGPQDKLPWAGNFKGKQEIADFFARVAANVDFTEFAPREMIEQGDTVVVIGTSSGRAKKTGKTIKGDWVHVCKYNQGRMVFFQEYTDTAAVVVGMS
jgi:ketosteroid isomerase-like protein